LQARDGINGCWVEAGPGANLPDVPPEVFGVCVADMDVELPNQSRGWVGGSEVGH